MPMASDQAPSLSGDVIAGRYRLDDEITIKANTEIWRGWDIRLQRRVSIRMVNAHAAIAEPARAAALKAAQVDERSLLAVLDIVETPGMLFIISEWTDWPTLEYLVRPPMTARDAIATTLLVAMALRSLHDQDGVHGCVRPGSAHLDPDGAVKLRGFEVDAALKELDQDRNSARQQDAQAVLNVLYLCLTGRWPEPDSRGRVASPARVVADVPAELEAFWRRNVDRPLAGRATIDTLMAELSMAESAILDRTESRTKRPIGRYAARGAALVAVGTAVAALTMMGITQAAQQREVGQARLAISQEALVSTNTVRQSPVNPDEKELPVTGLRTLDPDGDGSEYPHLLPNVIDGDSGTAWTTKPYYTDDMGGKRGVGVVLDLGYPQKVSAVGLELIGTSTDFSILVGNNPWGGLDSFFPVANVRSAGQDVFVRLPREVETRTVVVWFTQMPKMSNWSWVDVGYRAGIREASVYGPVETDDP